MIEFKNVSKHFGPTKVLHDIDLKINKGEVVVIEENFGIRVTEIIKD